MAARHPFRSRGSARWQSLVDSSEVDRLETGADDANAADDADDSSHDLARLSDLLHLRKIIDALYSRHVDWRCARRAVMQLNSIFLDEPDLPLSQSLAVGLTTAWDHSMEPLACRTDILTHPIARMLSARIDEGGER